MHELARHPLILMLKDSSSRQIVDLAFNREGLVSNVAYETTYGTTVAGLAQAGLGVGILPESMVGPSRCTSCRSAAGADPPHRHHRAGRPISVADSR